MWEMDMATLFLILALETTITVEVFEEVLLIETFTITFFTVFTKVISLIKIKMIWKEVN